jgi:hypothetical protein
MAHGVPQSKMMPACPSVVAELPFQDQLPVHLDKCILRRLLMFAYIHNYIT